MAPVTPDAPPCRHGLTLPPSSAWSTVPGGGLWKPWGLWPPTPLLSPGLEPGVRVATTECGRDPAQPRGGATMEPTPRPEVGMVLILRGGW